MDNADEASNGVNLVFASLYNSSTHGDIYRVLSRNACYGVFGTEGFVTWKLKW